KSGTLDGGSNDTERSGTLDGSGEDEAQSGIPYVNGEDEIQSSTFEEISEDEISRGSRDGSFGFDSDMSFNGETENQIIGNTLTVQHINAYRSHVTGGALDCVVDIRERSCTCRKYDIDKIPCEHALASADKRPNLHLQTLVHPYYTKSNLSGAYAESVNPVDVES
ncbi:hypothetical protein HID58_065281, partial [Brassica napus]